MLCKSRVVSLSFNAWTGRYNEDYLKIINERGAEGWRFLCFTPGTALPKGVKGTELVFEKEITTESGE
ncbi:MAG: DUF4177 domain-containing protein [Bacteroidota bacterium]